LFNENIILWHKLA